MIQDTKADRIFGIVNGVILTLLTLLIAYPLYFVVIASVSDYIAINSGRVVLWPVGLNFDSYQYVLEYNDIWNGYGNTIIIDHGFGYRTWYAHLRDFRTKVGKRVVRGEVIGGVGSTGKSTGPHLHYEVHVKGKVVNPINYYFMDLSAEDYDRMIQIAENHGKMLD